MKNNFVMIFVRGIAFVSMLFVCLVALHTLDSTAPFEVSDSVSNVTRQDGAFVLIESRGFVGDDTQVVTIFRTIYKKDKTEDTQETAIEGGAILNQRGEYVVLRTVVLPHHLNGAWCSRAVVYWRPLLSLAQHSVKLPDMCFEVPKK